MESQFREEQMLAICKSLIGKSVTEAKKVHSKIRLLREDGRKYVGSNDWVFDRINLEIDDGKVTSAEVG